VATGDSPLRSSPQLLKVTTAIGDYIIHRVLVSALTNYTVTLNCVSVAQCTALNSNKLFKLVN
jgi:hypothetical protein